MHLSRHQLPNGETLTPKPLRIADMHCDSTGSKEGSGEYHHLTLHILISCISALSLQRNKAPAYKLQSNIDAAINLRKYWKIITNGKVKVTLVKSLGLSNDHASARKGSPKSSFWKGERGCEVQRSYAFRETDVARRVLHIHSGHRCPTMHTAHGCIFWFPHPCHNSLFYTDLRIPYQILELVNLKSLCHMCNLEAIQIWILDPFRGWYVSEFKKFKKQLNFSKKNVFHMCMKNTHTWNNICREFQKYHKSVVSPQNTSPALAWKQSGVAACMFIRALSLQTEWLTCRLSADLVDIGPEHYWAK